MAIQIFSMKQFSSIKYLTIDDLNIADRKEYLKQIIMIINLDLKISFSDDFKEE